MKPIAFFLPSLRGGGAERVVVNLIRGIHARGHRVDLLLASAEGPYLAELGSAARVFDLGSRRVSSCVIPLARYLRRERPRVLISSMNHVNLAALCSRALARVDTRVIVTVHNTLSQTTRNGSAMSWIWPHVIRAVYSQAEEIVAVSAGAADDLASTSGLPRNRIEVIYNPVITRGLLEQAGRTPDHPWFREGEPPVVLGVGRLTAQKDFPTLIRAFAEVRRRRAARLVILGEGRDRSALASLIVELGLETDVDLAGFRDNAAAYMAGAAVFVLSSAWEGLPTVLIEAMATGTPVVSTDCKSGPREILQEGRLGALVPVGNPEALGEAIGRVLDCRVPPPSRQELLPFTDDAAVEHYLRLIERA